MSHATTEKTHYYIIILLVLGLMLNRICMCNRTCKETFLTLRIPVMNIELNIFRMLISLKSDLCRNLSQNGFLQSADPLDAEANLNSDNEALVRAVICSGLYPNTAKVSSG